MSSPRFVGPQGLELPHASRNRFRPATRPDAEPWALRAVPILLSACLILQPTADAHVKATRRGRSFLADLAAPESSSFAKNSSGRLQRSTKIHTQNGVPCGECGKRFVSG